MPRDLANTRTQVERALDLEERVDQRSPLITGRWRGWGCEALAPPAGCGWSSSISYSRPEARVT